MIDAQQCLVFQVNSSLGCWWRRILARDRTVFLTLLTKEEEKTQKWRVCQYDIIRKDLLAVCSCSCSELEVVHTGEENLPGQPSSWRKQCSLWISIEMLYFKSFKFAAWQRVMSNVSSSHPYILKYVYITKSVWVWTSSGKPRNPFLGQA